MSSLYLRVRAVGSNRSIVETLGPRKGSIMLYGVGHCWWCRRTRNCDRQRQRETGVGDGYDKKIPRLIAPCCWTAHVPILTVSQVYLEGSRESCPLPILRDTPSRSQNQTTRPTSSSSGKHQTRLIRVFRYPQTRQPSNRSLGCTTAIRLVLLANVSGTPMACHGRLMDIIHQGLQVIKLHIVDDSEGPW